MIPTKSNISNPGCSPVSSNCVLWQGPCLDCLNIQTGDTISDVTYKLAVEVCDLLNQLDLTDLDLSCIVEQCSACPQPERTLNAILSLLINKICTLEQLIPDPVNPPEPEELMIRVAACFETTDSNGDPVIELKISDYVKAIGNKVCALQSTVNLHTQTLEDHETRITALEEADHSQVLPTVSPTCIYGTDTAPKQIVDFLETLEGQFCQLRTATGTPNEIVQAVSKQCTGLNSEPRMSGSGTMSTISGWKTTTATAADAINNLWLTLCDLRAGVESLAECCAITCKDLIVDFLPTLSNQNQTLNLNFAGYSDVPAGFTDCNALGSKVTVTDPSGEKYETYIDLGDLIASGSPATIDLNSTNLTLVGTLNIMVDTCLTDNTLTCNKVVMKDIKMPETCSAPTNVTATVV